MRNEDGILILRRTDMEDNTKNKKRSALLTSPNPIAMASAGLSATPTSVMPPAIHGGIMQEDAHGDVEFNVGLSEQEVVDMMENSPIENSRFEKAQFEK